MTNWWLYVLKLEEGKYYVGITSQTPEIRMREHINHVRAAYWTMKYKPLELIEKKDLGGMTKVEAEKIENKKTREIMKIYGLNNVRGGDLSSNIAHSKTEDYAKLFGYFYMKKDADDIKTIAWMFVLMVIMFFLGRLSA